MRAPGALPLLEQERLGRPADEHVGAVFSHQYIANLLPGQTQTHETAEKIAVVERPRLVKAAAQRGNRVLLRAEGPVGQKVQLPPLGALIAAEEGVFALLRADGLQQAARRGLLLRGEKFRVRRDAAAAALFVFIPHTAEEQVLLGRGGRAVQKLASVHSCSPRFCV